MSGGVAVGSASRARAPFLLEAGAPSDQKVAALPAGGVGTITLDAHDATGLPTQAAADEWLGLGLGLGLGLWLGLGLAGHPTQAAAAEWQIAGSAEWQLRL